jgi:hypothetical protein
VSISGDTIVVGAPGESSNATGVNGDQNNEDASNSGAYVFVRDGTEWIQQAYLKATNSEAYDFFGTAVSISGDTIVVGALGECSNATGVYGDQNNNYAYGSGAAYVFMRNETTWIQQYYLKANSIQLMHGFGKAVAIGEQIVVGGYRIVTLYGSEKENYLYTK